MTEESWQSCAHSRLLLEYIREKTSDRKLKLFACACCRRIWSLLDDYRSQHAIEVAESDPDGGASPRELSESRRAAENAIPRTHDAKCLAAQVARDIAVGTPAFSARKAQSGCVDAVMALADSSSLFDEEVLFNDGHAARVNELREQANLLRHIIGNPFRSYAAPASWPSTVLQLAESLYNGHDCAFALHDALLEAGHVDLAEHFRNAQQWHPKGCWVVDLILGKS